MGWKKGTMVSVRISTDLHSRLQKIKEKTGVSIVFMIEKAVEEYLERRMKEGVE